MKVKNRSSPTKEVEEKSTTQLNSKKNFKKSDGPRKVNSSPISNSGNYLAGLSSSELTMIKRLAGNDPLERRKTMRKLKMWLTAIGKKAVDSPECRDKLEPNFIRVWKALFYCMWMADKPLPQEQLAEQMSNLIHIFNDKPHVMLLFVEWFFWTMAREWAWIDRFRLDKFMMLVRRFLRKTFNALSEYKWSKEITDEFTRILSTAVFNVDSSQNNIKSPLGFQIHLVDVYLEELAKSSSEELTSKKILRLIGPFLTQFASNDDERLLGEIQEKIFNYLMKQSDVGIDYQEELMGGAQEEEDSDDEEEEDEEMDGEEDEEQERLMEGPLDPRAGAVDVILPQLEVDYQALSSKLERMAKGPDIRRMNRKKLMGFSRRLMELVQGEYPLALPEFDTTRRAIPRNELKRAAKRLLEDQDDLYVDSKKKRTKAEKKNFKKVAAGFDDGLDFEEQKKGPEDEELEEGIDVEIHEKKTHKKKKKIQKSTPKKLVEKPNSPQKRSPSLDKVKPKFQSSNSPIKVKSPSPPAKGFQMNGLPKKKQSLPPLTQDPPKKISTPENIRKSPGGETQIILRSKIQQMVKRNSMSKTPTPNPSRMNSPRKTPMSNKRVSFVLNRNIEHEHADYKESIQRSPSIPFDAKKKPNGGLLKSPMPHSPLVGRKRSLASEFF